MANVLVGITGDVRETLNFYDRQLLRFSFQLLFVVQSAKIAKLCSLDKSSDTRSVGGEPSIAM